MAKPGSSEIDCFTITFEDVPYAGSSIYLSAQVKQRLLTLDADVSACCQHEGQLPSVVALSRGEMDVLGSAFITLRRIRNRSRKV